MFLCNLIGSKWISGIGDYLCVNENKFNWLFVV